MTKQIINVGTGPDSYTGDNLRTAFEKVNSNFNELYSGNAVIVPTSLGNLTVGGIHGQTITGSVPNANINIVPTGTGAVVLANLLFTEGNIRLGRDYEMFVGGNTAANLGIVTTAGRGNGNVSLQIRANLATTGILINAATGKIGFNSSFGSVMRPAGIGYDANFGGSVYANEYYANADFPTGYQFTTPFGLTGISHVYQNDINGNVSLLRIAHDSTEVAKFYENNHTILSGNLVVSQYGNVFTSGFPDAFVQAFSNTNSYSQAVFQNVNHGTEASFDIILTADNGNDSAYFGDFGIGSSTYNYPGYSIIKPNDVYVLAVGSTINPASPGNLRGNLILGSTTGTVKTFVGSPEDYNIISTASTSGFEITKGNLVVANGNAPTSANAVGKSGQIAWDSDFVYVCVATNAWKRANLSSW